MVIAIIQGALCGVMFFAVPGGLQALRRPGIVLGPVVFVVPASILQVRSAPERHDDRQKARTVWIIGVQPFIPAVYGVKAPL